jgi:hypothetical protein
MVGYLMEILIDLENYVYGGEGKKGAEESQEIEPKEDGEEVRG